MITKKQSKNRITQTFQKTYNRFLKIRGTPKEIALGMALGLFGWFGSIHFAASFQRVRTLVALAIIVALFLVGAKVALGNPGLGPFAVPVILLSLLSTVLFRDRVGYNVTLLAVTLPTIDIDGDGLPDLDASTLKYAGISMGSIMGTPFTAVEPMVTSSFLSVPMGGLARGLEASPTFGPTIRAGLASQGVLPGTADYELFFTAFQTVIDSMDPMEREYFMEELTIRSEFWDEYGSEVSYE